MSFFNKFYKNFENVSIKKSINHLPNRTPEEQRQMDFR